MTAPRHPIHPALNRVLLQMAQASAGLQSARLIAVSKTRSPAEIATLASAWRERHEDSSDAGMPLAFGENYVQEALTKQTALRSEPHGQDLEWHLIGHLQSNKAQDAATHFDWVHTVDRIKLIDALSKHRPAELTPLNVLIQVNIDDETSKHGCRPEDIDALAAAVAAQPRLQLRGLMAIPAPHADEALRRAAFKRMRRLFDVLHAHFTNVDTLSMGMSDDFCMAISEGATMVRVGSALFGPRVSSSEPTSIDTTSAGTISPSSMT